MKTVVSILTLLLFLGSQVGFNISTHFCSGEVYLKSVGILYEHLDCGMESDNTSICEYKNERIDSKCCYNQIDNFINSSNFESKSEIFDISTIGAVVFPFIVIMSYEHFEKKHNTHPNYRPPPFQKDITVFVQSFLI